MYKINNQQGIFKVPQSHWVSHRSISLSGCACFTIPLSYVHRHTSRMNYLQKDPQSHTEAAHKCFEFDKVVHVFVQKPESPFGKDFRVGPTGPRRDELE